MSNFLTPDRIITAKVDPSRAGSGETITIKQKITPDGVRATKDIAGHIKRDDLVKPNRKIGGDGKPRGICVHNTNMITMASGTNPAEQYARATFPNGNMSGVVIHYWVWKSEIWQQLRDDEQGWHAADGTSRRSSQRQGQQIGGNLDTISLEIIQSVADSETERIAALLIAHLLEKHNLSPDTDVYTHQYFFSGKRCPSILLPRWSAFMGEIRRRFSGSAPVPNPPVTPPTNPTPIATIKAGDVVRINSKATYFNGGTIPDWVKNQNWIVSEVRGDRAVIDRNVAGTNRINSPINTRFLTVVTSAAPSPPAQFQPYLVRVTTGELNIRCGPGTNHAVVGAIRDRGTYTIVDESNGVGANRWGRLKSGAGWISLDFTQKR